jgi:hypothetical protein
MRWATGSGKTWISCALAQQTCRQGASVMYWRVSRLIEELRVSHGDGSYIKLLKTISKASLIILDDWGLTALSAQDRTDLLEIPDDRVNTGSTLIASQLPVDTWHAYLTSSRNIRANCTVGKSSAHVWSSAFIRRNGSPTTSAGTATEHMMSWMFRLKDLFTLTLMPSRNRSANIAATARDAKQASIDRATSRCFP